VSEDMKRYGEYYDYGYCPAARHGPTTLPAGYWVVPERRWLSRWNWGGMNRGGV
jgi:hypothetical protein